MSRRRAVAALVLVVVLGWAPDAGARTRLHACGDHRRLTCGRVSVPLDPSGRVRGRISLFVERYAAVARPIGSVLALAGGPGQSGVDALAPFRTSLRSLLGKRALVVFDERGIGRSGPLDCLVPAGADLIGARITTCARQLGARARFYSTDDTVADMEAIRRALHLGRLDLYGVSYGTFPATQYARRHPSRVAHLVLDSSLPADGDLDVKLNSIASMRRQLASVCVLACPALDPTADLDSLLAAPALAPVGAIPGNPFATTLTRANVAEIVYEALFGSDLNPFLRASIPAALRLGARGNTSAMLRLGGLARAAAVISERDETLGRAAAGHPAAVKIDVEGLATRCEDERFAWSSRDPLAVRRSKVRREEALLSSASVAPFGPRAAIAGSGIADCERWPSAGAHPQRERGHLPTVPTLILSGENDVRTPVEQAATLAAQIPGARLFKVPSAGHAVLLNDRSGCAARALDAFFGATAPTPCAAAPPAPVDPLPPSSIAALTPPAALGGGPGEVLAASVLTLRHDAGFVQPYTDVGLAIAGTAGGDVFQDNQNGSAALALSDLSYVPGVALTGTLRTSRRFATGRLRVNLNGSPYGTLHLATDGTITGAVGGVTFSLTAGERAAIDTAGGLDFVAHL